MAKTIIETCTCERISTRIRLHRNGTASMVYTGHYRLHNGFTVSLDIDDTDGSVKEMVTKAIEEKDFSHFRQTFAVLRTGTACIAAPVYIDQDDSLIWISGMSLFEQISELKNKL